jgi:predicted nucleic acid-binding protein
VTVAYLDTSAFVKTVVEEAESERLRAWLSRWPERASSALLRTEACRAVRLHGVASVVRAREKMEELELLQVDRTILDAAADLPVEARSLDAIHLASALALGRDLGVIVTYDARMARAARALELDLAAP